MADDGFVSLDQFPHALGEVVGVGFAEDVDDLFAVADRELRCEIILYLTVLMWREFCGDRC